MSEITPEPARLSGPNVGKKLTRGDVEKMLAERSPKGDIWTSRIDLRGADLSSLDLGGLDLSNVDFVEANLCGTDLYGSSLRNSRFLYANLRKASLQSTDLRSTWFQFADLTGATVNAVDGLNLGFATLSLPIGLPSGSALLIPTPSRWWLQVGCWNGTPAELRTLIAQDEGWPEARGETILERRPLLEAFLAIVDHHVAQHQRYQDTLAEVWVDGVYVPMPPVERPGYGLF